MAFKQMPDPRGGSCRGSGAHQRLPPPPSPEQIGGNAPLPPLSPEQPCLPLASSAAIGHPAEQSCPIHRARGACHELNSTALQRKYTAWAAVTEQEGSAQQNSSRCVCADSHPRRRTILRAFDSRAPHNDAEMFCRDSCIISSWHVCVSGYLQKTSVLTACVTW